MTTSHSRVCVGLQLKSKAPSLHQDQAVGCTQAGTEPVGLSGRLNPEAERLHMPTGCPLPLQVTEVRRQRRQSWNSQQVRCPQGQGRLV